MAGLMELISVGDLSFCLLPSSCIKIHLFHWYYFWGSLFNDKDQLNSIVITQLRAPKYQE